MAVSIFARFINVRNAVNINHFGAVGSIINIIQHSDVISKSYCINSVTEDQDKTIPTSGRRKLNKAMKAYLERSSKYKKFMEEQITEYNIGKRHLAVMMGKDPDEFTQKDINTAIKYLFPSGLYDKEAQPIMKHPDDLYKHKREIEFNESGRPHHFLYYTTKPNYYEALHKIAQSLIHLNDMESKSLTTNNSTDLKVNVDTSEWLLKEELEKLFAENLSNSQYEYFKTSMERLINHPLSKKVEEFIMKYRKSLVFSTGDEYSYIKIVYSKDKIPTVTINDCKRKSAVGKVKVIGNGSGKININGKDINYFSHIQCREQVIFPLIFTNMANCVDIEAYVSGGGPSGQAGVIRYGISKGLIPFLDQEMVQNMKLAGLLQKDVRTRERKKWGQEGARRKFTWKKR